MIDEKKTLELPPTDLALYERYSEMFIRGAEIYKQTGSMYQPGSGGKLLVPVSDALAFAQFLKEKNILYTDLESRLQWAIEKFGLQEYFGGESNEKKEQKFEPTMILPKENSSDKRWDEESTVKETLKPEEKPKEKKEGPLVFLKGLFRK